MTGLLGKVPKPLYEDIARGRWIPIVGSGLSQNAIVPSGEPPPDWNGLASALRAELADPDDASDAVDVISAYGQEHGRPALVERVARAIRLADATPAPLHRSLCRLPLDVVMTTNFDTLLEDAFRSVAKPCHTVLDEPQLGLTNPFPGPTLLKIHGDVSRPDRMILTESDFDSFLLRNPLLATVVASHFAQRSVVLVGYSLSDPDLRQLLGMVRDRLGQGARAIYAIEVDASPSKISRFARRHVKVINLPGDHTIPGPTLDSLFRELYEAIGEQAPGRLIPKTHESGLAIRGRDSRRSCFLASSVESQPNFYEWLGPISSRLGVPLLTFQNFVAAGDTVLSAIDSMLAASGCAIVEQASAWTNVELGMALNRLGPEQVLVVAPRDVPLLSDAAGSVLVTKPESEEEWAAFAEVVQRWWEQVLGPAQEVQPEYHALVGEIVVLAGEVEQFLGDLLDAPTRERTLSRLLRDAEKAGLLSTRDSKVFRVFIELRNRVSHGQPIGAPPDDVRSLISDIRSFLNS